MRKQAFGRGDYFSDGLPYPCVLAHTGKLRMAKVRRRSSSALIFLGEYIHVQSDDWHFIFLRGGIAGMSKHCKRVDF